MKRLLISALFVLFATPVLADGGRLLPFGYQLSDANGTPISGGILCFDSAGTTTDLTVYSDAGLTTAIGSTVTTNSQGRVTSDVYSGVSAKITAYQSGTCAAPGSQLEVRDNVQPLTDFSDNYVDEVGGIALLGVTGGQNGNGTINATAIYDDDVQITARVCASSSGLTMTHAEATTPFAHGLGAAPSEVYAWFQNTTTEYGYAVGDRVPVSTFIQDDSSTEVGVVIYADATNAGAVIGDAIYLLDKSPSGGAVTQRTMTVGNWQMRIKVCL